MLVKKGTNKHNLLIWLGMSINVRHKVSATSKMSAGRKRIAKAFSVPSCSQTFARDFLNWLSHQERYLLSWHLIHLRTRGPVSEDTLSVPARGQFLTRVLSPSIVALCHTWSSSTALSPTKSLSPTPHAVAGGRLPKG